MRKSFSAADGYAQLDLVQVSRDHLFAAETLFKIDVRTLDSAGYLAQLGIELLLKALLLEATGKFPSEHSILNLVRMVKQVAPSFEIPEPYSDVLPLLDRYFELRYPAPSNVPGVTQGDWPVIEHIVGLIEQYLPEEVRRSADTTIRREKTGRRIIRTRDDLWRERRTRRSSRPA